ncbi:MAG: ferritin-like domain-containing protein [Acidobacteriota bacterium]
MKETDDDLIILREILARELETINVYQNLAARTENAEVAAFINHIAEEEKEHVAEAMEFINQMDASQASRFGAGAHWRQKSESSNPSSLQSTISKSHSFTVGSLREK